jgi:hypothetical protein
MHPQDYSDARSESRSFSRNRSAPSKRRQADARRRGGRYADIHWPLAVADGRVAVGTINKVGDVFVTADVRGTVIGRFGSLREAARSLPSGRAAP